MSSARKTRKDRKIHSLCEAEEGFGLKDVFYLSQKPHAPCARQRKMMLPSPASCEMANSASFDITPQPLAESRVANNLAKSMNPTLCSFTQALKLRIAALVSFTVMPSTPVRGRRRVTVLEPSFAGAAGRWIKNPETKQLRQTHGTCNSKPLAA